MKEIKTVNYIKKEAAQFGGRNDLPGDSSLPPGVTHRMIEENAGAFNEEKEDIVYDSEIENDPIEITIDGDDFNGWNENISLREGKKPEAWEYLPSGENTLKVYLKFIYDKNNEEFRQKDITKITSYDGGVDLRDIIDILESYRPFVKKLNGYIRNIIDH